MLILPMALPSQALAQDAAPSVEIVSDTHAQDPSAPYTAFSNRAVDFIRTAVRPPQVDVFSRRLLDVVLSDGVPEQLVIDLGDASNTSCTSELTSFFDQMNASGRPWMMALGNHDGYYMGSDGPQWRKVPMHAEWVNACSGTGLRDGGSAPDPMNSAAAVRLLAGEYAGAGAVCDGTPHDVSVPPAGHHHPPLTYICRVADEAKYWQSWIVSMVTLVDGTNPTMGVIVDTADYVHQPTVGGAVSRSRRPGNDVPNPGTDGNLSLNQRQAVDDMLRKIPSARVVLFGHHDLAAWMPESTVWLRESVPEFNIVGYVSGHTHRHLIETDYTYSLRSNTYPPTCSASQGTGVCVLREANLGSLLDNLEYGELTLLSSPAGIHVEARQIEPSTWCDGAPDGQWNAWFTAKAYHHLGFSGRARRAAIAMEALRRVYTGVRDLDRLEEIVPALYPADTRTPFVFDRDWPASIRRSYRDSLVDALARASGYERIHAASSEVLRREVCMVARTVEDDAPAGTVSRKVKDLNDTSRGPVGRLER